MRQGIRGRIKMSEEEKKEGGHVEWGERAQKLGINERKKEKRIR